MIVDPAGVDPQIAAASLRTFMCLSVTQRSAVILMDVLGYSMHETGEVSGASPAIKAALNRGRAQLRELARYPTTFPPRFAEDPSARFSAAYVDRFNARDFNAIRDMLAGDARLERVRQAAKEGPREVAAYFDNYAGGAIWDLLVDRWTGARPCSCTILDPRRGRRRISFCWSGQATGGLYGE